MANRYQLSYTQTPQNRWIMTVNVYDYCIKRRSRRREDSSTYWLSMARNIIEPKRKKREDKVETKICSGHWINTTFSLCTLNRDVIIVLKPLRKLYLQGFCESSVLLVHFMNVKRLQGKHSNLIWAMILYRWFLHLSFDLEMV